MLIRMTSETPDMFYPIAIEQKKLEMLIIASIQTLKRGNKKCGNEEVFNLVKDSVDGIIKKEIFNNLLDILVQKQSVKRNNIGNRECLSFPKETLQVSRKLLTSGQKSVDCSQETADSSHLIEDSSQTTVETLCSETFTQPNFERALNLKVELENLKSEIIPKIKDLIFNEISSFKDSFLKSFVNKASANQSSDSELHHQQILFLQKEITNKDNMIQYLLTQLSKQTDLIRKQHYELQREVLIDGKNTQYKNVHHSDRREAIIHQSVEQMAFTNDLILQPKSVAETTQADHTANIKAKDNHRSDKKSNNSSTSVISEKKNIVILGDSMIKHINGYKMSKKLENC